MALDALATGQRLNVSEGVWPGGRESLRCLTKPQEIGAFSPNVSRISDLSRPDRFVGFRPFAVVFEFLQRNDTRNDTRGEKLPGFLPETLWSALENCRPNVSQASLVETYAGGLRYRAPVNTRPLITGRVMNGGPSF